MREAYQSKIGQRILTTNLRVHLNPNFRESGLQQQHLSSVTTICLAEECILEYNYLYIYLTFLLSISIYLTNYLSSVTTICLAEECILESEEKETQYEKCERKPQSQLVKVILTTLYCTTFVLNYLLCVEISCA